MNGLELIFKERQEQIIKHRRTVDKDVAHNDGQQLVVAAIALIDPNTEQNTNDRFMNMPAVWDEKACARMATKDYKHRLIIAGALIAAEIDRILAVEAAQTNG